MPLPIPSQTRKSIDADTIDLKSDSDDEVLLDNKLLQG